MLSRVRAHEEHQERACAALAVGRRREGSDVALGRALAEPRRDLAAEDAHAAGGVRPFAVDVASGVETSPGVKDLELVRHFIDEVKSAY